MKLRGVSIFKPRRRRKAHHPYRVKRQAKTRYSAGRSAEAAPALFRARSEAVCRKGAQMITASQSGTYRAFHRYIVSRWPGPVSRSQDRIEVEVAASSDSREVARKLGAELLAMPAADVFIDWGIIVSKRADQ
jgi:hypothetical protein